MKSKKLWVIAVSAMSITLILSCGGGGGGGGGTASAGGAGGATQYVGTASPGDVFNVLSANGKIVIAMETSNPATGVPTGTNYFLGDITSLPTTGFKKISITSSSDTTIPLASYPLIAYGYEAAGTALVLKPADNPAANAVMTLSRGDCITTGSYTYNFVNLPGTAAWTQGTLGGAVGSQAYGVANVTVGANGSSWTNTGPTSTWDLAGNFITPGNTTTAECALGVTLFPGGTGKMFITASGLFIGDNGSGQGGFVGMKQPASAVNWTDVTASGRKFRGLVFKSGALGTTGNDRTQPVFADGDGMGNLNAGSYSNVETGIVAAGSGGTIALTSQTTNGILQVSMTPAAGPAQPTTMMINTVNGKYVIFGIGWDTGTTAPYHFLLMEQ